MAVHKIARPVKIIGTSTLGQRYYDETPEYEGLSMNCWCVKNMMY